MTPPYSLYFHIPFCTHRCAYCDFNTYAGQEAWIPAYVEAVCREVDYVSLSMQQERHEQGRVHTVFFGGGTPSLLSPEQFGLILEAIQRNFSITDDVEITIEANPGTVSFSDLRDLRSLGINRISYGVQSANANELRMLERAHNFLDVIEAVRSSRKPGFENLNLDLIYGLPEHTLDSWQVTVQRILDLRPEHISAYALTLEHGTPFGRWSSRGLMPIPEPDLAAEMYEWLSDTLHTNGYIQYEISNWAKDLCLSALTPDPSLFSPSLACRHNLQYWHSLPYLAFGAGAHGYAAGYRYSNVVRIKTYIDRLSNITQVSPIQFPFSPATVNQHKQTPGADMADYMLNNLRLVQAGVSNEDFKSRFGIELMDVYAVEIQDLAVVGLLERLGDSVRLTPRGRLLGNQAFLRL